MINQFIIPFLISLQFLNQIILTQASNPDLVTSWPQWGQYPPNSTYSGYLLVDSEGLRQIHYVFLLSLSPTSETDPLVIWMNGGPGCSSMLGLFQENGPYLLLGNNQSFYNNTDNNWNQHANVLYLETPPGVGYSINNDPNYIYNDTNTANDTLNAILYFYSIYQQYQDNDLYLSGESYAGMYVPFLSKAMLDYNSLQNKALTFNLKGFMLGNCVFTNNYTTDDYWTKLMYTTHYQFGPVLSQIYMQDCLGNMSIPKCKFFNYKAQQQMQNTDEYDIYAYTYPTDVESPAKFEKRKRSEKSIDQNIKTNNQKFNNINREHNFQRTGPNINLQNYLNNETTREAIHVANSNKTWITCNDTIFDVYQFPHDSYFIYPQLFQAGLKMFIYNGDVDSTVTFMQAEYQMNVVNSQNNITNSSDFLQWQTRSGQVGGWFQNFTNWTFVQVRGAGHEVPMYQHEAAFDLFMAFLFGNFS